nr:PREDICTED: homeodomain-interacting protein kinase 1-like [Stegastes partitus]
MAVDLGITKGSTLGKCHVVEDILGEGGFGVVAKCRNTETNKAVAVKVNKNEKDVLEQAVDEIAILKRLRCLEPDTCNIVQWDGIFLHKESICITFELLDQSLHHYLQEQNTWGLTMGELKPILQQLATALAHLHSIEIVHADIKPLNVMVVDRHQQPVKIKLIDFGLARPVADIKQGQLFGTHWYRAPEMSLGIPFREPLDVWALGLVMAELVLGCALYPGKTDYDVLKFIVETQGQPPDDVLDRGQCTQNYFCKQNYGTPRWRFKSPEDMYYEYGFYASESRTVKLKSLDELEEYMEPDVELQRDRKMLVNLIKSMLNLDASKRITAQEVLEHPFFASSLPENSSENAGEALAYTKDYTVVVKRELSRKAKLSLYQSIFVPTLTYGHELWGGWAQP